MAYSARYVFRFGSRNGTDYRITISQDGYSGEALVRHLGGAPVLRRDRSDHIWGTSLEIPAECAVDTEFAALYTSNPKEFLVTLDRSNAPSLERVTVWTGYISTELYSEPDIAPPYDVHIVATDCLGELKTTAFVGESRTLKAHLEHILAKTGLNLPIRTASVLAADSLTADDLMSSVVVDYSYLDGETDYEVLQTILSGINAEITRQGDAWIIFRQTDISSLEGTSRTGERLVRLRNITSGTGTSAPISAVTSMQQGDVWPVGRLSSVVDPARSHGVIRAPYHVVGSALDNPDMDSNAAWSTSGNALWEMDEDGNGWYRLRKDDDLTSSTGGSISQEIPIDSPNYTLRLLVKARMSLPSVATEGESSFSLFAHISMECKDGNDNTVTIHFGNRVGTFTHYPSARWTDSNAFYGLSVPAGSRGTESDLTEFEIFIPFSAAALGSYHDPTSLRVTLEARAYDRYTIISHCSLSAADVADGEQATIYLDNGARGEADAVELGMSDTIDYAGPQSFFQGFPSIAGSTVSLWSTGLLEGDTYLNTMAKDYAMGWALPRLRKEGSLNVPRNSAIPLFAESGEIDYIIETFQWDLLDDELNMSMVSLPAASLEVESIETAQYVTGSPGTGTGASSNTSMAQTLSGYATLSDLALKVSIADLKAVAFYAGSFRGTTSYDTTATRAVYIPTTLDHIADGTSRKLSDYALSADLDTLETSVGLLASAVENISDRLSTLESFWEVRSVTIGGVTRSYLHAKNNYGIVSDSFVSGYGVSTTRSGSGGGTVDILDPASGSSPSTFVWPAFSTAYEDHALSAYLGYQLDARLAAVEAVLPTLASSAVTSVVSTGDGNVVTDVAKSGNVVTVTKGLRAMKSKWVGEAAMEVMIDEGTTEKDVWYCVHTDDEDEDLVAIYIGSVEIAVADRNNGFDYTFPIAFTI